MRDNQRNTGELWLMWAAMSGYNWRIKNKGNTPKYADGHYQIGKIKLEI